jgi:sec-independent protein translocase protein TatA
MISTQTALILFAVVAVLFGARKLPEIGKGVGEAIKNFKKGVSDEEQTPAPLKKDETVASIEKKDQKAG